MFSSKDIYIKIDVSTNNLQNYTEIILLLTFG